MLSPARPGNIGELLAIPGQLIFGVGCNHCNAPRHSGKKCSSSRHVDQTIIIISASLFQRL